MAAKGSAYIVGAFEHPTRKAEGISLAQLHAECALGALEDAGLAAKDVDAYFCGSDAPGNRNFNMIEYLGMKCRYVDSTDTGGSSYVIHAAHAAQAIAAGKCDVALITLAGKPRSQPRRGTDKNPRSSFPDLPEGPYEDPYGAITMSHFAIPAQRHMYEYGTTSEQLAWIKVAMSHHAQHNPNAFLKKVMTVEDVINSPMLADPLHRGDACVVTDGGGALILARPEIARSLSQGGLKRPLVRVKGSGEAVKTPTGGPAELTYSAGVLSGKQAFEEAGVTQADIKYASIYDCFTIAVLIHLEDLGFCEKGQGGRFVENGSLISGVGRLPVNTDGGGLCNNHPNNRGGMTKVIEAVRQLRGEAHPRVQVKNCDLALAHAIGGSMALRHASATLIMERE